MKISLHPLKNVALTAALITSISFASAKDGADDGAQGGDISGSESVHQNTPLTPTADASAGAGGKVELEAENEDGTNTTTLKFELFGLAADTYTVAVTKKSDGSSTDIGTFDFQTTTPVDDNSSDSSAHPSRPVAKSKGGGSGSGGGGENEQEVSFGENGLTLPPDFNPLDIATITISNSSSVILLTADLTASTGLFKANVAVTAGSFAPDATGFATLKSQSKKGKVLIKQLHLVVKNLQGRTTYGVSVNGDPVGTARTNPKGKLSYTRLKNINPSTLHSVQITTVGGVAAQANF